MTFYKILRQLLQLPVIQGRVIITIVPPTAVYDSLSVLSALKRIIRNVYLAQKSRNRQLTLLALQAATPIC